MVTFVANVFLSAPPSRVFTLLSGHAHPSCLPYAIIMLATSEAGATQGKSTAGGIWWRGPGGGSVRSQKRWPRHTGRGFATIGGCP